MAHQFSLAHLTVMGCSPAEMTYIAAKAGYDYVSFRLIAMGNPGEMAFLPSDTAMIRATKAALKDTGVRLLDLELARILHNIEPRAYVPAMEAAAEMGARHVISSAWTTERNDRSFLVDRYSEICDYARPLGLTVDLEFPTFSRLTNLREAMDVVAAADRPNGGILVDTLYYHFSGLKPADLAAIPKQWLHFLHLCDTVKAIPSTVEGMKHIAREDRLYVGEGAIDFAAILKALPPIPMSIELPNDQRVKEFGYAEHARRCLATAKAVIDGAAADSHTGAAA